MEKKVKTGKLELEPVAEVKGAFIANVRGKHAVVCFHERNRAKAEDRFKSVTLRAARIKAAQSLAKTQNLPLFFAVQVRVRNKWDGGWLTTPELFRKHKLGRMDFSLSESARKAYAGNVRFAVGKTA
jgi:hypothetical protein